MRRKREAGNVLLFTALSLTVLTGFMGMGIDMGLLRYAKRLQQTAADAAALAGASNLGNGGVSEGVQNASAANGFTDNGGGQVSNCGASAAIGTICVQVNNPPLSGPHVGDAKYVEALVATVQPTYFMKLLNINQETVTARAVATNLSGGGPGSGCVYTLGPPASAVEGVNINGHATLNATTCGIADDGNFNTSGGALTVNAGTFSVSGNWDGCTQDPCGVKGNVSCTQQAASICPAVGAPAAGNPFANLTPPCNPCTGGSSMNINGTQTVTPGIYNSISIQSNGNVTFNPGIYEFTGSTGSGITCHGTPTITGTGVMFYFTGSSTFNCSGNDTINFTAPTATNCAACPAQYDGILMYQDPLDTQGPSLGGNTGAGYNGAIYFPKSEVTFFGNNSTISVGLVVADALALSGNPTVNLEGTAGLQGLGVTVNQITTAVLVE